MRIAFVTSQVITRHATMRRAFGMAPHLLQAGHRVTVLHEDHPDNHQASAGIPGLDVLAITGGLVAREEAAAKERALQKLDPDVVYICGLGWRNFVRPSTVPRAIFHPDHVELESSLPGSSIARRAHLSVLEWGSLFRYRHHVVASQYLRDLFGRRARWLRLDRPIHYFPYAVDPFDPVPEGELMRWKAERRLGRFVLYAGGWYRNYGLFTMLEAAAKVANDHPDFHLILLGRGPDRAEAETFLKAKHIQEQVRFEGFAAEDSLHTWFSAAEALLSPLHDTQTDWARCPSKIPRYMAARRPVVTCRIGEASTYLGSHGHYYEPGCPDSLSKVLKDLWVKGPLPPVPYDLEQVSWKQGTHQWLEFIQPLLAGKGLLPKT